MSYIFQERPKSAIPSTIEIPPIEKRMLNGGDTIHILSTKTTSLIQLEIRFNAGSWVQNKPFQALLTSKMVSEGTKSYNSKTIAETIDFYGGYYAIGADKDYASAQFVFPSKYLSSILPIISEILFESIIPEQELHIIKDNLIHQIKLDNQRGDVIANKKLFATLYGPQHPYGRNANHEEVNAIDRTKIQEFYNQNYRQRNMAIFVVGDLEENQITLIEKALSPKRQISQNSEIHFEISPDLEKNHTLYREQSTQSSIRIGKVLFTKQHPDYIDTHIASTVLGGYFGSRLMNNLREDKGYTYGIGSYLISYLHSGFFGISTEVGLEHTDQAVTEIIKEIKTLCDTKISDEELTRVKNYLAGNYLKNFDGSFNIMNQYTSLITQNLSQSFAHQYLIAISKITADRIQALFNQYLTPDSFCQIIVKKQG